MTTAPDTRAELLAELLAERFPKRWERASWWARHQATRDHATAQARAEALRAANDLAIAARDAGPIPAPQTRAQRVLAKLAEGRTPAQVCAELGLKAETIAEHLRKADHIAEARPFRAMANADRKRNRCVCCGTPVHRDSERCAACNRAEQTTYSPALKFGQERKP